MEGIRDGLAVVGGVVLFLASVATVALLYGALVREVIRRRTWR